MRHGLKNNETTRCAREMPEIITATVVSHDFRYRRLTAYILANDSGWACTVMKRGGKKVEALLPTLAPPGASLAGRFWRAMSAVGQHQIEFVLDSRDVLVLACGPTLALQRPSEAVSVAVSGRRIRATWQGEDAGITISAIAPREADVPAASLTRAVELASWLDTQGGCARLLMDTVAGPY